MPTIRFATGPLTTFVFLLATLTGFSGCSRAPTAPSSTPSWYERTQPRYALADVEIAINSFDRAQLEACLAADFVYYFDPAEIGEQYNGYTVPVFWDRDTFVAAVDAFIEHTASVEVNTAWQTCEAPAPAETTYYAANFPFLATVIADNGAGYRLDEGNCNYAFERDARGKWTLAKWWDRTYGCGCAGVPLSWGQLLIRYGYRP